MPDFVSDLGSHAVGASRRGRDDGARRTGSGANGDRGRFRRVPTVTIVAAGMSNMTAASAVVIASFVKRILNPSRAMALRLGLTNPGVGSPAGSLAPDHNGSRDSMRLAVR